MPKARLEHVNITVADPDATAARLCRMFGGKVRWTGDAAMGGYSVHVGTEDTYLAIYNPGNLNGEVSRRYTQTGGLNHVGLVVDDLDAVSRAVSAEGFVPRDHADYEPGQRFYFTDDTDHVEYEVVSYA